MHIEFKKLTLHNFISFGHSELLFNDDGFVRVSGINENPLDNAGSNGSGKSSLWEAVIWALTGDTIRGTKQVSNLYGDDGTYVELDFNIDKSHYNIIRAKDHKQYKTSLIINIDGKDCSGKGIRDSEKLLQQYLPDITASLLGSVIILGQGLPQKFTNNSPSGRKEVLEKLSKSDFMIEDLKSRVITRRIELQQLIRQCEDNILTLNNTQLILSNQINDATNKLTNISKQSFEDRLAVVNDSIDRFEDTIELIKSTIEKLDSDKETVLNRINSYTNMYAEKFEELSQHYDPRLLAHQKEQAELGGRIQALNKQITNIQNIKDICPTCGQKLQGVEKPDATPLMVEYEDLKKDAQIITQAITQLMDEYSAAKKKLNEEKQKDVEYHQSDLNSITQQISFQNKQLSAIQADYTKYLAEQSKIRSELAALDATIQNLQNIIQVNTQQLAENELKITQVSLEKDNHQEHLNVITKFDTELKRDFRGYLLHNIIEYISKRAKQYCKTIFDTDLIDFQLDGNNIDISYMEKAYENLSGGEKQKIDLIIQFSIRDMLCNHLGFTSNILVLDEVFDGLDMLGCQRVLDVISNITDIKNIFIVTHRKDLSIPTDKELVVVKSANGISSLR